MVKKRIIIVEDEVLVAANIKIALETLGYEVAGSFRNGEDAINAVDKLLPDLALMDIRIMGEIDGIETARRIKLRHEIPVIYLTAYLNKEIFERAKVTNPYGYLVKPFDERELMLVIEIALLKNESEKKSRENERWLNTVLNSINDGVIATDPEGNVRFMNSAAEALTLWKSEESAGRPVSDIVRIKSEGEDIVSGDPVGYVRKNARATGILNHTILINKNGDEIAINHLASPIKNEENQVEGIVLLLQDISEKRKAEKKLRESEKKFRLIFEKTSVGMFITDAGGRFQDANPAFCSFLNYTSEELREKTIFEVTHPDDYEKSLKVFSKLLSLSDEDTQLEKRYITKEGKVVWGISNGVNISRKYDKDMYMAVVQDITKKKETENTLMEKEESYKLLVESSSYPIFVISGKNLLMVNKAWEEMFGCSFEEIKAGKFCPGESFFQFEKRPDNHEAIRFESTVKSKKGNSIIVDVSLSKINWKGIPAYQGIIRDITGKKKEEEQLRIAKENAEKADKLKSEFLAQMSHEIRTPLNNILTFTSLIRDEVEETLPAGLGSSFNIIDKSAQRLIKTIDSILNLSRIQSGNFEIYPEILDLEKDILEDIFLELYPRLAEGNLELKFQNRSAGCNIRADRHTCGQIFINLLDNAVKYTAEGSITVAIYNEAEKVCVEISDTGVGITPQFLPVIFNPFSQEDTGTTRKYDGAGLGMALVKKYTDLNNGEIMVSSEKGKGTTFRVYFDNANPGKK